MLTFKDFLVYAGIFSVFIMFLGMYGLVVTEYREKALASSANGKHPLVLKAQAACALEFRVCRLLTVGGLVVLLATISSGYAYFN